MARVVVLGSAAAVAYSSDTSPCDAVVALARDADVLIHEAAKDTLGHSSAAQAGEVAPPGRCRPSGADPLPACFLAVRPLA